MDRYILQSPDSRLTVRAQTVEDLSAASEVVAKMLEIAHQIRTNLYQYPRGFEMAAPQIGEPYRIIILQGDYRPDFSHVDTTVLVNPEIVEESDFHFNWEDCLSAKDMRGYVKRCGRVRVRYLDLEGELHERDYQGDKAADVQHGIDHLDGRLFFERDMKYFIPLSVYRPLKDKGIDVLNVYVAANYRVFDGAQYFSPPEMEQHGLTHPRQCLRVN